MSNVQIFFINSTTVRSYANARLVKCRAGKTTWHIYYCKKINKFTVSKTTAMAVPVHSPFHKELSGLAFFISLPQLVASPIVVGLKHLLYHDVAAFDVKEVIDFLLISFPLTLSIAALVVIIQRGQLNPYSLLIAVAGAALLSNLLHMLLEEIPSVDVTNSFTETFGNPENSGSGNLLFTWIGKIFGIYWKTFGPILFIQSCCIGIYAGDKFLKMEKKKNNAKK